MPLLYYPSPGEIVMCRYDDVVIEPEMRKARPAVVVGPRLRRRGRLVTVVPLSTTAPEPPESYHCRIELSDALPAPFDSPIMWAKCDMVAAVSLARLDRFRGVQQRRGGPRRWTTGKLTPDQFLAVQRSVLCGLGLFTLTNQA